MRKKWCVIIVFIIVITAVFPKVIIAEDEIYEKIEELKEQRKLAQEEIFKNSAKVDELEIQISDLMAEIQNLSTNIYKYELEIAVLDKEVEELDIKIRQVEAQLAQAERKYMKQKDLLNRRIVTLYEEGETYYLDVLLGSKDIVDFISRYYIISEIAELDNEMLRSYKVQKEQVDLVKKELDEYYTQLKEKKYEQEKSAIVLSNIRVIKNNQMAYLSQEEQQLQREIDEYQKQVQEIEVELLIALTANLGSEYVGGALAWPVPGYTAITSNFGMRIHPIYGVYRMHQGTDIAAPTGAYFIAANDGVIVTSRYSPSYGNLVVIDHGGGLSTLYAHGEERLVEVGDTVRRGEPVLKVGSTGVSTGPHAHFEVRINGICVEPLDYILNKNNISNLINDTEGEQTDE